ncbi:hypothetical protein F0L68_05800 [Solihabitans fulvus]|uniref:Uncharacterized protein n=1 Tax=Solihabitans fulvus TaxID=1892852 RepID=A0A5B2XMJ3_9PSEU|nr:hypothetical protein [Solihabitans fulvus]KAA2264613.1 hypothetical protein F0L68_05800 [Solihabitans fulvus]
MSTMPPSGQPTSEQLRRQDLMQQIGIALLDVAPDNWRRIDLLARMTSTVQDLALTVYLADTTTPEVVPPRGIGVALAELRQLMYEPGRGTWFSARCTIDPPGKFNISYNTDHDPNWNPPLLAEPWVRDLQAYPRDDEHTPDWLRAKLTDARREEQN